MCAKKLSLSKVVTSEVVSKTDLQNPNPVKKTLGPGPCIKKLSAQCKVLYVQSMSCE